MTITKFDIPKNIYKDISYTGNLKYEDVINHYEDTFEYEKVWMKASDFKSALVKELWDD